MIPKGLFAQMLLLAFSVAIVLTYIQPKFAEIGSLQDDILIYQNTRDDIVTVNNRLNSLVARLTDVPPEDEMKLLAYLPTKVDAVSVLRELYFMTQEVNLLYVDSSFDGQGAANDQSENSPIPHSFTLMVEGPYENIKDLLRLIESNNYPLEVHDLNISQQEGGFLSVDLRLVTYSYNDGLEQSGNRLNF